MNVRLERLQAELTERLAEALDNSVIRLKELTLEVQAASWPATAKILRDEFHFEQLIDLCGVDYLTYEGRERGPRFAIVCHLLSVEHNLRLRVRVFAQDDTLPVLSSVESIWSAANWMEREAFDLFGILFEGHPDLRRLLTDYGFIGHPFRKDFPVSGYVEMRYDEQQKRVVYQPLTLVPREIVPRITRPDNYGDNEHHG
ncbi:NADH-quinone oxidoreductase subunit C [Ferrovum sp. JA12]|uniref:NADH-quinone oxidoreductase subunit C n=1 Tax=Ferrovum sp. JA12 TaxID=1356299 RepID=UPI00406C9CB5